MAWRQSSNVAFTPRELLLGGYVAAALWLLSVALLVTLAAWSIGPGWIA